jgi:hypothetical protein
VPGDGCRSPKEVAVANQDELRILANKELPDNLSRILQPAPNIAFLALADLAMRAGFIDENLIADIIPELISISQDTSRPPVLTNNSQCRRILPFDVDYRI